MSQHLYEKSHQQSGTDGPRTRKRLAAETGLRYSRPASVGRRLFHTTRTCSRGLPVLYALLLALFCFSSAAHADSHAAADDKTVHVYILSGQSNMVGAGQASELPAPWQRPVRGVYIYKGGSYVPLVAGKDGKSGRFGPEVALGKVLRQQQQDGPAIYLIKFALSGQPLDAGWGKASANGGGWAGPEPGPNRKTFYPGTSPDDPNMGLHYKRLTAHIAAGLKKIRDDGHQPKIMGVLWMQGEADAKHEVSAGRYDRSLALLKKRIEEDHNDAKALPFVFGQVLPHEPALARFTSRGLIRERMAQADHRSGDQRAIDGIWMVPTDNMELKKDTVHYSTKGLLQLGEAFANTMIEAHGNKSDDTLKEDAAPDK